MYLFYLSKITTLILTYLQQRAGQIVFCYLLPGIFFTISATQSESLATPGASLIQQTGLRQYATEQGLSQNTVRQVFQDHQGFIWLATDAGLNRLEGSELEVVAGPGGLLSASSIRAISQDDHGHLWISTYQELVRLMPDGERGEVYRLPSYSQDKESRNFAVKVFTASEKNYWLISQQGIFMLEVESRELKTFPAMRILSKAGAKIRDGLLLNETIWLTTNKGLFRFESKTGSLQPVSVAFDGMSPSGPPDFDRISLTHNGHLWLTGAQGIFQVNRAQLHDSFKAPLQLTVIFNQAVEATVTYKDHAFWASGDTLYRYFWQNSQLEPVMTLSELLPGYSHYRIRSLFVDANGKLWMGTDNQGAYVWDPGSVNFQTIWAYLNQTKGSLQTPTRLTNQTVWSIIESPPDHFWIATDNGLNQFDPKQAQLTHHLRYPDNQLSENQSQFFDLLQLDQQIWLATADGLVKYDPMTKNRQVFRPAAIDPNDSFLIYSLAATPDGQIWLATEHGILRFSPNQSAFSFERGLMAEENAEASTLVRYHNNKLWFGLRDRLISYDPKTRHRHILFEIESKTAAQDSYLTDFYFDQPNHLLWAAFSGEGIYLFQFDPENPQAEPILQRKFDRQSGFVDNVVFSLLADDPFLWATTHSGLVKIDRRDNSYITYDYYDGLPSNEFNEGASLKSSRGLFYLGNANGLVILDPKAIAEPEPPLPVISRVLVENQPVELEPIKDKPGVLVKEDQDLLQIKLSVTDYLSPHKWQYQYWLTGAQNSPVQTTTNNLLNFFDLQGGDYQLHIRTSLPGSPKVSPTSTLDFSVKRRFWSPFEFENAVYLIAALLSFWYLYRRSKIKHQMVQLNQELSSKKNRLEMILLDKTRGVWEWHKTPDDLENSQIIISLWGHHDITLSLSKYVSQIFPRDLNKVKQAWLRFLQGDQAEFVMTYRLYFFERWIWVRVFGKATEHDLSGKPVSATGSWTDISEEVEAEEKARLYQSAVQSTRDIIFIVDRRFRLQIINRAFLQHTGFEPDHLMGKNLLRKAMRYLPAEDLAKIKQAMVKSTAWQCEIHMPRNSAPNYPAEIRVDTILKNGKPSHHVVVVSDLSQLNQRLTSNTSLIYGGQKSTKGLNQPHLGRITDHIIHAIHYAQKNENGQKSGQIIGLVLLRVDENFMSFDQVKKRLLPHLNQLDSLTHINNHQYVILLEELGSLEALFFGVQKIEQAFANQSDSWQEMPNQPICFGISCYPYDGDEPHQLLEKAQQAMDAASNNDLTCAYANEKLSKQASEAIQLKTALGTALDRGGFFLVFQPKYNFSSQKLVGFEALTRLKGENGQTLYPSQFISVAEQTGQAVLLNHWLIENAYQTLASWHEQGINTSIAVNINPLYESAEELLQHLLKMQRAYPIGLSNLHIEFNEDDFINNLSTSSQLLYQLNEQGYKVTLDSFGKNNLALLNLRNLPFYAIKIDQGYIRKIGENPSDESLVKAFIDLTNSLGFLPCAKGIENQQQVDFLHQVGCYIGQGYYFSDPLSAENALVLASTA